MFQKTASRRRAPLHFRRIELKYLIPDRIIPMFIDRIKPYTQPDPFLIEEGRGRLEYPVTSLYFDSMDLHALHEKESGLLSRRKVRLRTYEDSFLETASAFLEIKRRHDFIVSKDRLSLSMDKIDESLPMSELLDHLLKNIEASEDVTHEANMLNKWFNLQPTTLISYHRIPFVGMQDRRFRITIDSNIGASWKPQSLYGKPFLTSCHPGWSVLELKSNHAVPSWFHDTIQDFQLTRTSHSKYSIGTLSSRERLEWKD